jgi:hypothetical protein
MIGIRFGAAVPNAAAPFSPTSIAGLGLWLKADSLMLTDGTQIATWADQSGNGNDVSQPNTSCQPIFKAGIINGLPVARFYDDSGLIIATGQGLIYRASASLTVGTVCAVASNRSAAFSNYDGLFGGSNGDSGTGLYNTGSIALSMWYPNTFTSQYVGGVSEGATIPTLNQVNLYSGVNSSPLTISGIYIGNDRDLNLGRNWNGDIAEILVYSSALSDADRASVESYLNTKYDL